MPADTHTYLVEVYNDDGAKEKDPDKLVARCVSLSLNEENALLSVQRFYPPPQHSHVVYEAETKSPTVINISHLEELSRNFEE